MAAPAFKPPPFKGTGAKLGLAPAPSASSKEKKRRPKYQTISYLNDDSEGNWLVSYADMMTLLFGFFVMLNAFSVPDAGKMENLKKQTAESMGGKYTKPFEQLSNSVQQTLSAINLSKDVSVAETDEGVTIVSKGTLFFDSGSATLKPEASSLMDKISDVLAKQAKDFKIIVEGHTDDSPIRSEEFPSNWELSAVRAGSVIRLLESKGIPRKNLRPVGLADIEPISPNRDNNGVPIPTNQAENRRIVIRVQKQLPKRLNDSKSQTASTPKTNGGPTPASNAPVAASNASATAVKTSPDAPSAAVPTSATPPVATAPSAATATPAK